MLTYDKFLEELKGYAEPKFAAFQKKLIFTKAEILGVRTPILRTLSKKYKDEEESLFTFPNDCYEVTFIKLAVAANLPYDRFLRRLDECVEAIDNWATCDTFKPKALKKDRLDEFLPILLSYLNNAGEFYQRFVLVTLLSYYMEKKYLPICKECLKAANTEAYYVHMAAAWLTAEILVNHFEKGLEILKEEILSVKTHDKAIQKARESYRLTAFQKEYLNTLKRKKEQ